MYTLLSKLVLFCLIFGKCYGQGNEVIRSLGESIKSHLDCDPTTANFLNKVYSQGLTEEFKNLLYLSLNSLFITNELFTSNDQDTYANKYLLPQGSDFIQREVEEVLGQLEEANRVDF